MLSDEQLIGLVQSKGPADLSPNEIRQLRLRLKESESLRAALLHTLQMENYLAQALGPEPVDPKQVLAWERTRRQAWWAAATTFAMVLIAAPLAIFLALVLWNATPELPTAPAVAKSSSGTNTKPLSDKSAADADSHQSKPQAADDPGASPELIVPPGTNKEKSPPTVVIESPSTDAAPALVPEPRSPKPFEIPEGPWSEAFAQPVEERRSFATRMLDEFPLTERPSEASLAKWFTAAPGHARNIKTEDVAAYKSASLEGMVRLTPPLPVWSTLRIKLANTRRLRFYAWSGAAGAALVHHPNQNDRLAAYVVQRSSAGPTPERWRQVDSDEYRGWRAELAPWAEYALRHIPGRLQLWRSDVLLVEAPVPTTDTPDSVLSEIYLDVDAAVMGIDAIRTAVEEPTPPPSAPYATHRPADLLWRTRFPTGGKLHRHADGAVELDARGRKQVSVAWFDWQPTVLEEIELEFDRCPPGCGVALMDGDGETWEAYQYTIRAFRNQRDGGVFVTSRGADEATELNVASPLETPVAYVGDKLWLKIVPGAGGFSWHTSPDGLHWAAGDQAIPVRYGKTTGIGIVATGATDQSVAVLRSVTRRRASVFARVAPEELVARAPVLDGAIGWGAWHVACLHTKPLDASWTQWRRACLVRALAAGMPRDYWLRAAEGLLDDVFSDPTTEAWRGELLAELWRHHPTPQVWNLRWNDLLAQPSREFSPATYFAARRLRLTTPEAIAVRSDMNENLIALRNLLAAMPVMPLSTAREAVDGVRLFRQDIANPMVDWSEWIVRGQARPGLYGPPTGSRAETRSLLHDPTSKAAYDTWSEMINALDSRDFATAIRLAADSPPEQLDELIVAQGDGELFLSLADAWRERCRESTELQAAMATEGPRAALRLRQAVELGDASAIGPVAATFPLVPAGGEAQLRLGEQALVRGLFTTAAARFRSALDGWNPAEESGETRRREALAKVRFADAMRGRYVAETPAGAIEFGAKTIDAGKFETWLATTAANRAATNMAAGAVSPTSSVLPEATYKLETRAAYDGPFGQAPDQEVARFTGQLLIDWAGRQLSVVPDGDTFFVANRFGLSRWRATDWQKVWQAQAPPGEPLRSQDWPMIAMRPQIGATRVWARMLVGKTPTLGCWDKETGKLLWSAGGEEAEVLMGDPIVADQRVFGFLWNRATSPGGRVSFVEWDAETGETLRRRFLYSLNDTWQLRHGFESTLVGDRIVTSLAGAVACCDLEGRPRWLRDAWHTPVDHDTAGPRQHFAPPIVVGERVFVVQPGSPTIDCLALATGRLLWRRVWPDATRLVGVHGDLLVVECRDAVVALQQADGAQAWRYAPADLVNIGGNQAYSQIGGGATLGNGKLVVQTRFFPEVNSAKHVLSLTWLDPTTGSPTVESSVEGADGDDVRLAPVFHAAGKWIGMLAKDKSANRAFVEFTRVGDAAPASPNRTAKWLASVKPEWWRAAQAVAPHWTWVSINGPNPSGLVVDAHGEKQVVGLKAAAQEPIALAREVRLAAGQPNRLTLRVADEANAAWKLEVRFNRELVAEQEIVEKNPPERWKNLSFDLSPWAGKDGTISVIATPAIGVDSAVLYWKSVELSL